jgi:hypothetical protein
MAVFFAAAGVKLPVLNFSPCINYLLRYGSNICRTNHNFFFPVIFLFIGFYKIKFSACNFPVF